MMCDSVRLGEHAPGCDAQLHRHSNHNRKQLSTMQICRPYTNTHTGTRCVRHVMGAVAQVSCVGAACVRMYRAAFICHAWQLVVSPGTNHSKIRAAKLPWRPPSTHPSAPTPKHTPPRKLHPQIARSSNGRPAWCDQYATTPKDLTELSVSFGMIRPLYTHVFYAFVKLRAC